MASEGSWSLLPAEPRQPTRLGQSDSASLSYQALPANDSPTFDYLSYGDIALHDDGVRHLSPPQGDSSFYEPQAQGRAGDSVDRDSRDAPKEPSISTRRLQGNSQPRQRSFTERWFQDWWTLEIISIVCSALSFVAMIGVLASYSGRPLDEWSAPVKINTAIALFSTLSKSSLLLAVSACIGQLKWQYFTRQPRKLADLQSFDEASRGPWGACDLIFRSRGRSVLATFAAVAVVLALVIDPFAQQVVSFPANEVHAANESAFISRAQSYDTGKPDTTGRTTSAFAPLQLQGAVYRGIYNLRSDDMFYCPTGNCDYPPFASMEVCSSCWDVTTESQRECWVYPNTTDAVPAGKHVENGFMYCNYTLPFGANLWTGSSQSAEGPFNTLVNSTGQVGRQFGNSTLARTMTVRLPEEGVYDLPFGEVHECVLTLCVKSYANVKVRQGILDDSDVVEYSLTKAGDWLESEPYTAIKMFRVAGESDDYAFNRTFSFNTGDMVSAWWFLADLLTVSQLSSAYYVDDPLQVTIGYALQKATNISHLYDNIAKSLSNHLRSGPNSTIHYGMTVSTVPFIHVRWAWLILPAALIVSGLVLLIALILSTKRSNIALWKSSALALLFHGIPEDQLPKATDSSAALRSVSGMENASDNYTVRLCTVHDTTRLLHFRPGKEDEAFR